MALLCDLDQFVRNLVINKILFTRETRKLPNVMIGSDAVQGGCMEPMEEAVNRKIVSNDSIQKFIIPNLNLRTKARHQLATLMILIFVNLQQNNI